MPQSRLFAEHYSGLGAICLTKRGFTADTKFGKTGGAKPTPVTSPSHDWDLGGGGGGEYTQRGIHLEDMSGCLK